MNRRDFLILTGAVAAAAVDEPPYKQGKGWQALIKPKGKGLPNWSAEHGKGHEWYRAGFVKAEGKTLQGDGKPGDIIVNGPQGKTDNIYTNTKFGDCELYIEFMVPQGSNSGIYLHGLYEIQVFDSFGVAKPSTTDCGAIYHRWINEKPVGGSPPLANASAKPGEWQSFHAWFEAPKFDVGGKKTANAKFTRVLHNSVLVQQDVEVDGGTRAHMEIAEAPLNPLMLQGDHGPVAYRNIYIRAAQKKRT
jgi:hypothetical protein